MGTDLGACLRLSLLFLGLLSLSPFALHGRSICFLRVFKRLNRQLALLLKQGIEIFMTFDLNLIKTLRISSVG